MTTPRPPRFKHIPLEPYPPGRIQRDSSKDSRINKHRQYMAWDNNRWVVGFFSEAWYGWSLHIGSHGVQLDSIDGPLFEIIPDDEHVPVQVQSLERTRVIDSD